MAGVTAVLFFRDITDDEAFVDELRVTLRFFAAVLVRRTQKVKSYGVELKYLDVDQLIFFFSLVYLRWM